MGLPYMVVLTMLYVVNGINYIIIYIKQPYKWPDQNEGEIGSWNSVINISM